MVSAVAVAPVTFARGQGSFVESFEPRLRKLDESATTWYYLITSGAGMAKGLCSGDCTGLPPMWPGFDSRLVATCGLSLLLVLYSAPRGFAMGSLGFKTSPQKPTFL